MKNCIEEIITSTAYLDLFLRTINEPNLLKIFLKFILHAKFDEKYTLLDTLINRIALNTKVIFQFKIKTKNKLIYLNTNIA